MKKFARILSLIAVPVIAGCVALSGCKGCGKKVNSDIGIIMQDFEVAPTQKAYYEEQTKQAYADFKAVADKHVDESGLVDYENEEVQAAAKTAAAKMFAYACYNERQLDQYVFFSKMDATTDLGDVNGSGDAVRNEYYLRVNETEKSCGYRYHYTLKKVVRAEKIISTFKSQFETANLRFTDNTDQLYRFSGSDIKFGRNNEPLDMDLLECTWKTDTSKGDWGEHELQIKKREPIAPENIQDDIKEWAGVDIKGKDTTTIRGNINILAENVIKSAIISESPEDGCIVAITTIDTEVANKDEASLKMLRQANDSKDCHWVADKDSTGFQLVYVLWPNGLFRNYIISEKWAGKIVTFSGEVSAISYYYYSYSDRDCDMTDNLKMLEEAKKLVG
ncbi:MAG: hypothetical protein K2N22_06880 [Clostridia bacterium]|nr:hypothetical protein [Clostridia bacterium]